MILQVRYEGLGMNFSVSGLLIYLDLGNAMQGEPRFTEGLDGMWLSSNRSTTIIELWLYFCLSQSLRDLVC